MPWYFSFPFHVFPGFPHPRLALGWAAATMPVVAAALAVLVLALWVVLYLATSADAVFAAVLGGAALAAHRRLVRRSAGWTVAGGVLLLFATRW